MSVDSNVVECELAERDRGFCVCGSGTTLNVLKDVRRAYEERMEFIARKGGPRMLQMQVDVLKSWVSDLLAQNTLLVQTVEELETEITTKLLQERRKLAEMVCELRAETAVLRRSLARKDSDLRGMIEVLRRLREFDCNTDGIHFYSITESDIYGPELWQRDRGGYVCETSNQLKLINESLQKENVAKEREIRRLIKETQEYEQVLHNLRHDLSRSNGGSPVVQKVDAEATADLCYCTARDCSETIPVKDYTEILRNNKDEQREYIQKIETSSELTCDKAYALQAKNVELVEKVRGLNIFCSIYDQQLVEIKVHSKFQEDIIRELCRQLRKAKAKIKEIKGSFMKQEVELGRMPSPSYESVTVAVRRQVRKKRRSPENCHHLCDGAGDDSFSK